MSILKKYEFESFDKTSKDVQRLANCFYPFMHINDKITFALKISAMVLASMTANEHDEDKKYLAQLCRKPVQRITKDLADALDYNKIDPNWGIHGMEAQNRLAIITSFYEGGDEEDEEEDEEAVEAVEQPLPNRPGKSSTLEEMRARRLALRVLASDDDDE